MASRSSEAVATTESESLLCVLARLHRSNALPEVLSGLTFPELFLFAPGQGRRLLSADERDALAALGEPIASTYLSDDDDKDKSDGSAATPRRLFGLVQDGGDMLLFAAAFAGGVRILGQCCDSDALPKLHCRRQLLLRLLPAPLGHSVAALCLGDEQQLCIAEAQPLAALHAWILPDRRRRADLLPAFVRCFPRLAAAPLLDSLLTSAPDDLLPALRLAVDAGVALDAVDAGGQTALHRAAAAGHVHRVTALLDAGAAPHCTDAGGRTPQQLAAALGHDDVVAVLQQRAPIHVDHLNSNLIQSNSNLIQSTNPSTNPSTNQSTNQSTNPSTNQSIPNDNQTTKNNHEDDDAGSNDSAEQQTKVATSARDLRRLGRLHYASGDYALAVDIYEQLVGTLAESDAERPQPAYARSLGRLGDCLVRLGQHGAAIERYLQELVVWKRQLGDQPHARVASCFVRLAHCYCALTDYACSQQYYQWALEMQLQLHPKHDGHPLVAACFNNLARVHALMGDAQLAVALFQRALAIYAQLPAHPHAATCWLNQGDAYFSLGNYSAAVDCFERAIASDKQAAIFASFSPLSPSSSSSLSLSPSSSSPPSSSSSSPNNQPSGNNQSSPSSSSSSPPSFSSSPSTSRSSPRGASAMAPLSLASQQLRLDCYLKLGDAFYFLGDFLGAIDNYRLALVSSQQLHSGRPHRTIAVALNKLGGAYSAGGDHRLAAEFHLQAVDVLESVVGRQTAHADVEVFLRNTGLAYCHSGQHDLAVDYLRRAFVMAQQLHESAHPAVARAAQQLGAALGLAGDHAGAIAHCQQALATLRSSDTDHDKESRDAAAAACLLQLGDGHYCLGDYRHAVDFYNEAEALHRAALHNAPSCDYARTLYNLGLAYVAVGEATRAVDCFRNSLATFELLSDARPQRCIADALCALGVVHSLLGDESAAVAYLQRCLNMRKQLHRLAPHPDVAETLRYLGFARCALGHFEPAIMCLESALAMREQLHGPAPSRFVVRALADLALVLSRSGELRRAIDYYERSLAVQTHCPGLSTPAEQASNLQALSDITMACGLLDQSAAYASRAAELLAVKPAN